MMQLTLKLSLLVLCSFILMNIQNVEAKRFGGGGKSFGSSAHRNAASEKSNPTRTANTQKRSGFLGGLLGGLLAGSLLGALFFGGFSGFGFVDIVLLVLLGVIAWFVLKKLRQRTTSTTPTTESTPKTESTLDALFQKYNKK